jgi:hypothetical protein
MLPPNDSIQHQNLKLAEFLSGIHTSQAPPPAYSAASTLAPASYDDQLTDSDDDYDPVPPCPAPITININASLRIEGHANTIILPPASNSSTSPSSKLSATAAESPRGPQQGRVERLTDMVFTALKDAGVLDSDVEVDGQTIRRPIEVNVDAGIILKGSKNTICKGLPRLVKAAGRDRGRLGAEGKGEEAHTLGTYRKRRACSVCYYLGPQSHDGLLTRAQGTSRILSGEEGSLVLSRPCYVHTCQIDALQHEGNLNCRQLELTSAISTVRPCLCLLRPGWN